jgi:DNA replication protein DnaC
MRSGNSTLTSLRADIRSREFWRRTCPHCGEVKEPRRVDGFYIPGRCDCPGAQAERERQEQEREEREIQKRQERLRLALEHAGLKKRLQGLTFESFDRRAQPEAYDAAMGFFDHPTSLIFCGPVGVGKSHLAAAILNKWIRTGFEYGINEPEGGIVGGRGYFISLAALLLRLRNSFQDGAIESEAFILENLIRFPLLAVDDLGKEKTTDYSQQTLFHIIDSRYVHDRPVIVTSNATGKAFADAVGAAVFSRLIEMGEVIELEGRDYRMRKHSALAEAEQIALMAGRDDR